MATKIDTVFKHLNIKGCDRSQIIYLINFQPLWDRSQIKLNKLFNAQNGQIIA